MGRQHPEQARIRIIYSGIPGVEEKEFAADVVEDTAGHHAAAVRDAFDQAQASLTAMRAAAGVVDVAKRGKAE